MAFPPVPFLVSLVPRRLHCAAVAIRRTVRSCRREEGHGRTHLRLQLPPLPFRTHLTPTLPSYKVLPQERFMLKEQSSAHSQICRKFNHLPLLLSLNLIYMAAGRNIYEIFEIYLTRMGHIGGECYSLVKWG